MVWGGLARRSRWIGALASGAVQLAIVLALLFKLGGYTPLGVESALVSVDFAVPRPPAPPPPPPAHQHKAAGRPSPANLRAKAAAVFAPKIAPNPPVVAAAPHPGVANGADNGAAAALGPGGGAGGAGNGTGAGGDGTGEGAGGDDAELIGGQIKASDYPADALAAHADGTTGVEISVSAQGRPTQCSVAQSSGSRSLDSATCRLVMQRFRFRPAHDGTGRAVAGGIDFDQKWTIGVPPP